LFAGKGRLLQSHRGWDPGALLVATSLARRFEVELIAATTTPQLVVLNSSPHNPPVVSRFASEGLTGEQREALLCGMHRLHWDRIRTALRRSKRPVVHVGVHSFTPNLNGDRRDFEVGILYDPQRTRERAFAASWKRELQWIRPDLRVRRNAPYRGNSDGLTTAMRKELGAGRYLGFELELNQRLLGRAKERPALIEGLAAALHRALESAAVF
jgi:predicted N-formylglutamate amidohydrolase